MKITFKEKIIFALVFIFLVWSRLYQLDKIPATLSHDETVYAIQAKSFVLQGKTLNQSQSFFSLKPVHIMYAELPAQLMTIGFLLTDNPLVATHLLSALMGILLPFIMAWFTWTIWKKPLLSKSTWLVFVFSPLFWQMSRVSYDAFYSLWLYILAGTLLIQQNRKAILLSIPIFLLGFFQYQGFKLLLVPWIGFLLVLLVGTKLEKFNRKELWQQIKKIRYQVLVLFLGLLLMIFYGFVLLPKQNAATRLDSLIFTNTEYLEKIVNTERRLSLDNPFVKVASNKGTAIVVFMLQRLVGVFNPNTLLLLLEPNVSGFSVWSHGVFYWMEIVLLFLGLAGLVVHQRTRFSGIVLFLGMATLCLPALLNSGSEWYLLRSMFSYLLVTILAAWGLTFAWRQKYLKMVVLFFYIANVFNFSYNYWYRYPIISLDWANFDERILARYISLHQLTNPEMKITVYGPEPEYDFWSYLLYSQKLNKESASAIAQTAQKYQPYISNEAEYTLGNVTFSSFCAPDDPELYGLSSGEQSEGVAIIRNGHKTCPVDDKEKLRRELAAKKQPILSISAVLDSGQRLRIYGDNLCLPLATTYVDVRSIGQLAIESQNLNTFCSLWIKNLGLVK